MLPTEPAPAVEAARSAVEPADLPAGLVLRRAADDEADAVADVFIRVRRENADAIPELVHDESSIRAWVSAVMLGHQEVWVAERDGAVVGFMALRRPDWVENLYLLAGSTGLGVGSALLDIARRELGGKLQLWTFQSNTGARRFYERHGFVGVEMTDGDNEEGAPDIRYALTS